MSYYILPHLGTNPQFQCPHISNIHAINIYIRSLRYTQKCSDTHSHYNIFISAITMFFTRRSSLFPFSFQKVIQSNHNILGDKKKKDTFTNSIHISTFFTKFNTHQLYVFIGIIIIIHKHNQQKFIFSLFIRSPSTTEEQLHNVMQLHYHHHHHGHWQRAI
jgi:hypothetical protein